MAEKLIITIGEDGQRRKKVYFLDGEKFTSLKGLAEGISENFADAFKQGEICLSETKPSMSQEEWKKLEDYVKDFLEDSTEDVFDEVTAYA